LPRCDLRAIALAMSLYDLKTQHLDGSPADLGQYRGTVTLVVNVASECGFTPQYAGLQRLQQDISGKGFAVLGFPSNEFGGQEPGSPEQIKTFCERNYGVTFPMFAKVETKPGRSSHRSTRFSSAAETRRTGTSASTSWGRTARSAPSFRATWA